MKTNYPKDAIDVLAWSGMDAMAMLRQIAKDRPAALVKAAMALGYKPPVNLQTKVLKLMADGYKIDAIKLVRNETSMGLAEAKEYVEKLAA